MKGATPPLLPNGLVAAAGIQAVRRGTETLLGLPKDSGYGWYGDAALTLGAALVITQVAGIGAERQVETQK